MSAICHIEYETTDIARAQAFFEGLFGWTFKSFTDNMVIFGQGEKHIGGLQRVSAVKTSNSPSVWFDVEDFDAKLGKAVEVGGTILEPKKEVPHVGWSAQVGDPDGNPVGMVQFAEQ